MMMTMMMSKYLKQARQGGQTGEARLLVDFLWRGTKVASQLFSTIDKESQSKTKQSKAKQSEKSKKAKQSGIIRALLYDWLGISSFVLHWCTSHMKVKITYWPGPRWGDWWAPPGPGGPQGGWCTQVASSSPPQSRDRTHPSPRSDSSPAIRRVDKNCHEILINLQSCSTLFLVVTMNVLWSTSGPTIHPSGPCPAFLWSQYSTKICMRLHLWVILTLQILQFRRKKYKKEDLNPSFRPEE